MYEVVGVDQICNYSEPTCANNLKAFLRKFRWSVNWQHVLPGELTTELPAHFLSIQNSHRPEGHSRVEE